jgi:hypothetical protein
MEGLIRTKFKIVCLLMLLAFIPLSPILSLDMSGWRKPTKAEIADDIDWRKESKTLYLTAEADFDGDGKIDKASLLVNDKKNKMGLFVILGGSKPASPRLLDEMKKSLIQAMGISVVESGRYETACGKGYLECEKDEPKVLDLEIPAINYFKEGSVSSFFYWDRKKKSFKRTWISD